MILTSDYHTHTVFSHGKGNIIDNAMMAKEKGLKEIGISDHGFAHPAFGLTKSKLPTMRELVDKASIESGVKTLLGIESNIIGEEGTTDLKSKYYDYFDIYFAGFHKFVMYKFKSLFTLSIPNLFRTYFKGKPSKSLINRDTKAYINVIKNNPVDAITHLNFCCFADSLEVAKCAADYGTYIELNSKKEHLTDEELYEMLKTDVRFIINSDAHEPNRVGEISLIEEKLKRMNFPLDRIDNIDGRLPNFRFAKFKNGEQK